MHSAFLLATTPALSPGGDNSLWYALTFLLTLVTLGVGGWAARMKGKVAQHSATIEELRQTADARKDQAEAWQSELAAVKEEMARLKLQIEVAAARAEKAEQALELVMREHVGTEVGKQILAKLDLVLARS